jgi:hypothetical protein
MDFRLSVAMSLEEYKSNVREFLKSVSQYIIKAVEDGIWLYCKIKCHFIVSASYCMSQKTEKPVLSGQRIKTRKRGELMVFLLYLYKVTSYCSCAVQST